MAMEKRRALLFLCYYLVHHSVYNWTVYELLLDIDYFRRVVGLVSPVLLRRRQHCSCA